MAYHRTRRRPSRSMSPATAVRSAVRFPSATRAVASLCPRSPSPSTPPGAARPDRQQRELLVREHPQRDVHHYAVDFGSGEFQCSSSPASYTGVVVNSGSVSGENFSAVVAYNISGNVSYSGSQTGQTYLYLQNNNCGGNGGPGTSITQATLTSGGAYTIHGVRPGNYTLNAWMDSTGVTSGTKYPGQQGQPNTNNPTGSNSSVSVPPRAYWRGCRHEQSNVFDAEQQSVNGGVPSAGGVANPLPAVDCQQCKRQQRGGCQRIYC